MNLKEIRALLELFREYGLTEVEIERNGERVRVRREPPAPAPAAAPAAAATAGTGPVSASQAAPSVEALHDDRRDHLVTVEAPMVGTFYRAPSPDADPYVREGDVIKEGQVLCIIEAMKIMNEIEAEIAGVVREISVEDSQPVEFGQVLFRVDPNG
jgi:acetyl-CoA carboxylase biotin carboxyl carrier protein